MIVSFLIPTRGRFQGLLDGIKSIKKTASSHVQLEFLVRIDQDDEGTLAIRDRIPGEIIVGPRWCGYNSIHTFLNELAAKSHGDWIIPWSDDTFMETRHWDKLLPPIDAVNCAYIYWLDLPGSWKWALPIMTRKLYNMWGCFAPSPPVDATLFNMWVAAGKPLQKRSEITVEHLRNEKNIRALAIRPEDAVPPPQNLFAPVDGNRLVEILRNEPWTVSNDALLQMIKN